MGTQALSLFCATCRGETGHTKSTTNHVLHLILSLVTLGFWIIPWIIIALVNTGAPKCSHCGAAYYAGNSARVKASLAQSPASLPQGGGAQRAMKRCPYCAEEIMYEALKCKHCGSSVDPSLGRAL